MSNGNDKEKVVDLIQKCLRLSKSSNENEAAAALAKAQELLEKYNLDMAEVHTGDDGYQLPEMVEELAHVGSAEWKKYLVHYVAKNNMCRIILDDAECVNILGRTANVAAVVEMSNWILGQLNRMVTQEVAQVRSATYDSVTKTFTRAHESKLKWRTDFLWGAIHQIDKRLTESRSERVAVNPNTKALVVNLERETNEFFRSKHPNSSSHRRSGRSHGNGYAAGQAAGDKVSLFGSSRQVDSGTKRLTSG